jgi:hypothetical protein
MWLLREFGDGGASARRSGSFLLLFFKKEVLFLLPSIPESSPAAGLLACRKVVDASFRWHDGW